MKNDSTPRQRSIGELVASIRDQLVGVVRQEAEIAKAEVRSAATKGGIGAAAFLVAGLILVLALLLLMVGLGFGFAAWFGWPTWAGFFLMVGVFLVLAALIGLVGYLMIKRVKAPEQTIATGRNTVNALRGQRPANPVSYDDEFEDLYGRRAAPRGGSSASGD
jgi:protein-S-isoprenylcysteine O-methyltransferase Ste14